MRVTVTGGAGFIGANLVRHLVDDPQFDEVVVIDDLSTGSKDNLADVSGRITFVEGSILDDDALQAATEGADAIVHLAARPSVPRSLSDPVASHHANATGTIAVLEAARAVGTPHVIIASSSSVYGANAQLPKHEGMAPMPLSPYAASKLATEAYALAYAASFGLPVLVFRFFNVFGPLQAAGHAYAAVVPAFVSAAVEGRPLTIHGDGGQTRDFTYVDSVTSVIAAALTRQVTAPAAVNLAFGTRHRVLDLVRSLERVLGRPLEVEHVEQRAGDVRDSQADTARLSELFPDLTPVPFEDGLRQTVRWFRAQR